MNVKMAMRKAKKLGIEVKTVVAMMTVLQHQKQN